MTNETNDQGIHTRSPLLAEVLSFVMAGLGQIYAGQFTKGIKLLFVSVLCGTIGAFALLPVGYVARTVCLGSWGVGLAIWLYAIFDARRSAKRAPADYVLKDYNRWYVYLLLVLVQIPVGVGWSMYVRAGILQAFRMTGDAMAPTIQSGERVLVNKLAYQSEPVRRADIVALINPNNRSQTNIKRVVALPGDRIEVRGGEVILNGKQLGHAVETAKGTSDKALLEEVGGREYPIALPTGQAAGAASLPETTVPNGHCVVLNDNRANTYDSRQYGLVPLGDILGRVDYIYWPLRSTFSH